MCQTKSALHYTHNLHSTYIGTSCKAEIKSARVEIEIYIMYIHILSHVKPWANGPLTSLIASPFQSPKTGTTGYRLGFTSKCSIHFTIQGIMDHYNPIPLPIPRLRLRGHLRFFSFISSEASRPAQPGANYKLKHKYLHEKSVIYRYHHLFYVPISVVCVIPIHTYIFTI